MLLTNLRLKGAMKTKYKVGLLQRPLCSDNKTNFIANSEQAIAILKEADGAVATPQSLSGNVFTTSWKVVRAIGSRRPKPLPEKIPYFRAYNPHQKYGNFSGCG